MKKVKTQIVPQLDKAELQEAVKDLAKMTSTVHDVSCHVKLIAQYAQPMIERSMALVNDSRIRLIPMLADSAEDLSARAAQIMVEERMIRLSIQVALFGEPQDEDLKEHVVADFFGRPVTTPTVPAAPHFVKPVKVRKAKVKR